MHRLLIAVTLLLLAPLAFAQAYKWTDAAGTVHYSEAPPAAGIHYKKVATNGSVEPLVAAEPAAKAEVSGGAAAAPAKPVADTPENRSHLCESLKTNLAALQGSAPVVMEQAGKATALDDNQRKQQLGTAQAQYQQYCETK